MLRNTLAAVTLIASLLPSWVLADSPGPSVNLYRAYPPSCLADPLPTTPIGPTWSKTITVATQVSNASAPATEDVTLTFWRSPCSNGASALLGLFQRSSQNLGHTDYVPEFPAIVVLLGTQQFPVRVASEPNTVRSSLVQGTPVSGSAAFVLENLPTSTAAQFNFAQAEVLAFLGGIPNNPTPAPPPPSLSIPAYDPSQYPAAALALPITGYLTGNWLDPAHSGEGIQTEIGELGAPGTANNRYITAAWYTYTTAGTPYWLFASGLFTAGDRSATLSVYYTSNGGFAGNFGTTVTSTPWGTMTVAFPNCRTLNFSYQANAGLPSGVPTGSGSKTWARLTQMNGLNCH